MEAGSLVIRLSPHCLHLIQVLLLVEPTSVHGKILPQHFLRVMLLLHLRCLLADPVGVYCLQGVDEVTVSAFLLHLVLVELLQFEVSLPEGYFVHLCLQLIVPCVFLDHGTPEIIVCFVCYSAEIATLSIKIDLRVLKSVRQ